MNDIYTLPQLFAGHLFRIPDYQRGYAWGEKECRELLEDLEALPTGKRHHCGTLTLQTCADGQVTDAEGSVYDVLDIVDGQQRLTSLVILLDAIARELAALGDQASFRKSQGIRQTYLATEDGNLEPLPKLTLNSDCHALFYSAVLELGVPFMAAPTMARVLRARRSVRTSCCWERRRISRRTCRRGRPSAAKSTGPGWKSCGSS